MYFFFLVESHQDLKQVFDDKVESYCLQAFELGLNKTTFELRTMTEEQLISFFKEERQESNANPFRITPPTLPSKLEMLRPSSIMILPFSLADEAFTCGEAVIYREFSKELHLGIEKKADYIPTFKGAKKLDIQSARERFKLYRELDVHVKDIENLKQSFEAKKQFQQELEEEDEDPLTGNEIPTSVNFKTLLKQREAKMKTLIEELSEIIDSHASAEEAMVHIKAKQGAWFSFKDDCDRSVIHVAVEKGLSCLVKCLLMCGAGVNDYEGCGATPLLLAVIKQDPQMVDLLIQFGGRVSGTFPGNVISPLQAAFMLGNEVIISKLQAAREKVEGIEKNLVTLLLDGYENEERMIPTVNENLHHISPQIIGGRNIVISIGDVKTTTTTRGLKNRAPDEFGVFSETPGDFHCIGYVLESLSKIYGPGGFYYVIRQTLRRVKISPQSFEKIFKEENYERCFEAMSDFYWGLAIAAVQEFYASEYFPSKEDMEVWLKDNLDANGLLHTKFNEWVVNLRGQDKTFDYFIEFVCYYGPLLQVYQHSVRHGLGQLREACWIHLLPIFAALNKKNYRDETFVHVTNFTSFWPLAVREMFRKNCSISLKGKLGHNLALDEFVETIMVRPLKVYGKKHTTLSMLQKVNMNLELLEHVKDTYKKGFGVNTTGKHTRADSTPDRQKVAWFALKEEWFKNKSRDFVAVYNHNKKEVEPASERSHVSNRLLNIKERGKKYITEHFNEMQLRLFPNYDFTNPNGSEQKPSTSSVIPP